MNANTKKLSLDHLIIKFYSMTKRLLLIESFFLRVNVGEAFLPTTYGISQDLKGSVHREAPQF
jgi:hypothetical protein